MPNGHDGTARSRAAGATEIQTLVITIGGGLALLVVFLMLCFWTYRLVKKRRLAKQKQQFLL